jgi:hypothetical protein
MPELLTARLAIAPLALVELGVVAWYFLYWDLFPKYSAQRLVPWLIFIMSVIGIPLLQIGIYRKLASAKEVDDVVVLLEIFLESLCSVGLIFVVLLIRRSRK